MLSYITSLFAANKNKAEPAQLNTVIVEPIQPIIDDLVARYELSIDECRDLFWQADEMGLLVTDTVDLNPIQRVLFDKYMGALNRSQDLYFELLGHGYTGFQEVGFLSQLNEEKQAHEHHKATVEKTLDDLVRDYGMENEYAAIDMGYDNLPYYGMNAFAQQHYGYLY